MKDTARSLFRLSFVLYLIALLYILYGSRIPKLDWPFDAYYERYCSFIPFETITKFARRLFSEDREKAMKAVVNLFGNLVLFAPMGIYMPCFCPKTRRFWKLLLTMIGMVVVVELAQFFFRFGMLDVDDILLNVTGAMAAYELLKIPQLELWLTRCGLLSPRQSPALQESAASENV